VKGIVLAGGGGSRLYPATKSVSKQLLAVYDKPMIYYPLWTLVNGGIREILIISTPRDLPTIEALLGDGRDLGLSIAYAEQPTPGGIAEAFMIGKDFIGSESVTLILGDNLFIGHDFDAEFAGALSTFTNGAEIYLKAVPDPERFGVATIGADGAVQSVIEKPTSSVSNLAVTGLYTFSADVVTVAAQLPRSDRNELEITDVNAHYLQRGSLRYTVIPESVQWIDAGTPDSLVAASMEIQRCTRDQGSEIGYVEIAAFRRGYISKDALLRIAEHTPSNVYAARLRLAAQGESS
jgi:glucose-1-phosphate thymidylyltransferase